jgi:hypothetical protein
MELQQGATQQLQPPDHFAFQMRPLHFRLSMPEVSGVEPVLPTRQPVLSTQLLPDRERTKLFTRLPVAVATPTPSILW